MIQRPGNPRLVISLYSVYIRRTADPKEAEWIKSLMLIDIPSDPRNQDLKVLFYNSLAPLKDTLS
jgi:hypothetical protein